MKKKVLLIAEFVGKEMSHDEEIKKYVFENYEEKIVSILTKSFILNPLGEDIRKTGVKIYTTESIELPYEEVFDEVIAYDEYGETTKERFKDTVKDEVSDEKPEKKRRKAKE